MAQSRTFNREVLKFVVFLQYGGLLLLWLLGGLGLVLSLCRHDGGMERREDCR